MSAPQLVIGTTNPAKLRRYQTILSEYPTLEVLTLGDFANPPEVAETGLTAAENARQKARAYAAWLRLPVLGVDESLLIPALPENDQPGVNVRRYLGFAASDEQLLEGFLAKVRQIPADQRFLVWTYAIHLAFPAGRDFFGEVELTKQLVLQPSGPYPAGYPLSALQVDLKSGKALNDLSTAEEREHLAVVYVKVGEILRQAGLVS
jgi:inosine/xanthosine triphosphate pyrophosphatase family protein